MGETTKPAAQPINVLLLDEQSDDAKLIELVLSGELPSASLSESDRAIRVTHVSEPFDLSQRLMQADVDVLVCDLDLSWNSGIRVVEHITSSWPHLPVIVCSRAAASTGLKAIKAGAVDFVEKSSAGFIALPDAVRTAARGLRSTIDRQPQPLADLLEASRVGTFALDRDGKLVSANDAFLQLVGCASLEHAKLRNLTELLGIDISVLGAIAPIEKHIELSRGGRPLPARLTYVPSRRPVSGGVPAKSPSAAGPGLGLLQPLHQLDVVTSPEGEDLATSPAFSAPNEEIAAVLAHELREPIRMIEKYTQLLASEYAGALDAEGSQYMDFALDGARRLSSVVDNLLLLNRTIESGELALVSCEEIVEGVLEQLSHQLEQEGAGVHLDPLPTVKANATQLGIVFRNLIENALKFRGSDTPRVWISAKQRRDEWVLSVRDNGRGIEESQRSRIFEGFRRLHPDVEGSGLGLTICRRILEHHRGRIWVESSDSGSTFCFSLPLAGNISRLDPNRRPRGLRTASR